MFGIDTDHDPITPSTTELLEELGLDVHAVRETLADDLVRRCPDRAGAGGLELKESLKEVSGRALERVSGPRRSPTHRQSSRHQGAMTWPLDSTERNSSGASARTSP